MTESQTFARLHSSAKPAHPVRSHDTQPTIYRDTAFTDAPFTHADLYATDDSDRIAPLLQIGLAALLLPTFAYTLSVLIPMTANGTLEKAVRALLP